jgi:hypothetical protein
MLLLAWLAVAACMQEAVDVWSDGEDLPQALTEMAVPPAEEVVAVSETITESINRGVKRKAEDLLESIEHKLLRFVPPDVVHAAAPARVQVAIPLARRVRVPIGVRLPVASECKIAHTRYTEPTEEIDRTELIHAAHQRLQSYNNAVHDVVITVLIGCIAAASFSMYLNPWEVPQDFLKRPLYQRASHVLAISREMQVLVAVLVATILLEAVHEIAFKRDIYIRRLV